MPTDITINNITGASPYHVYLCDNPITTCVYVVTISTLPYTFTLPSILSSQDDFTLKIVDSNHCIITQTLTLL